jgi:predicted HTH domain antitoxin
MDFLVSKILSRRIHFILTSLISLMSLLEMGKLLCNRDGHHEELNDERIKDDHSQCDKLNPLPLISN